MNKLAITTHAAVRMAQRGMNLKDSELIVLKGTEVDDGYLVRSKDYQEVERVLKSVSYRGSRSYQKHKSA